MVQTMWCSVYVPEQFGQMVHTIQLKKRITQEISVRRSCSKQAQNLNIVSEHCKIFETTQVIGFENVAPSTGSVNLFKGDTYWKFTFPGSSQQDGYPRSSAVDWLDCTDSSSSSPVIDELSLSPPGERQEFREQWKEDHEKEYVTGRGRDHWGDRHGREHKDTQDRGSHIWTQCTCQNGALHSSMSFFTLLLIIWTLLGI